MFTYSRQAYNVVVLPDQVGHVTRIIPLGSTKFLYKISRLVPTIHSSCSGGIFFDLSTIRITSFSHQTVGSVLARISISLLVLVTEETLAS